MEAWKEELYHWGIKGMKWKKRKKSAVETAAQNYENAYKRYSQTGSIQDFKAADRNKSSRAINNYKAKRKIAMVARGGVHHLIGATRAAARQDEAGWNRHLNAFQKNYSKRSKAATHRRVKRAEAKYKAKTYLKNLFGKGKK
jgi:hypothetical protein